MVSLHQTLNHKYFVTCPTPRHAASQFLKTKGWTEVFCFFCTESAFTIIVCLLSFETNIFNITNAYDQAIEWIVKKWSYVHGFHGLLWMTIKSSTTEKLKVYLIVNKSFHLLYQQVKICTCPSTGINFIGGQKHKKSKWLISLSNSTCNKHQDKRINTYPYTS